jgi:hypothetical protein
MKNRILLAACLLSIPGLTSCATGETELSTGGGGSGASGGATSAGGAGGSGGAGAAGGGGTTSAGGDGGDGGGGARRGQDASATRSFRAGMSTGIGSPGLFVTMLKSMCCAGRWNMKAR